MKNNIILNLFFAIGCISAQADIVVPGANGTDGALNITEDTVIDLSQAPTGVWDQDNSAQAGKGVYDPEKWAVVFKYTSVSVAAGKKLTFKNNASRAPVVWLVSGDVTIAGTVDLSGQSHGTATTYHPTNHPLGGALTEPGPGGFRGGAPMRGGDVLQGAGFGPGGGIRNPANRNYGTAAGFGTSGSITAWNGGTAGASYGNPSMIPLIGGSGGAGGTGDWGAGGLGEGLVEERFLLLQRRRFRSYPLANFWHVEVAVITAPTGAPAAEVEGEFE